MTRYRETGSLPAMAQTEVSVAVRQAWGEQLREERQRRDLKQAEVAELAGVSQQAVSDAERGLRIDDLITVAAALGIVLVARPPEQAEVG